MTVPTTPVYKLNKPPFDRRNYHDLINNNFSILEAVLSQFIQVTGLLGAWENATAYMAGDKVVDVTTSAVYQCLVDHVSPVLPTTFAQDRVANPLRWAKYGFVITDFMPLVGGTFTGPVSFNSAANVDFHAPITSTSSVSFSAGMSASTATLNGLTLNANPIGTAFGTSVGNVVTVGTGNALPSLSGANLFNLPTSSGVLPISSITGSTTGASADVGRIIDFTGTSKSFYTTPSAGLVGVGRFIELRNDSNVSSGAPFAVTASTGTLGPDLLTQLTAYSHEGMRLISDGSNFKVADLRAPTGTRVLLQETNVASAVASLSFSVGLDDTEFSSYEVEVFGCNVASAALIGRMGTTGSGGDVTTTAYTLNLAGQNNGGALNTSTVNASSWLLTPTTDADVRSSMSLRIYYPNFHSTSQIKTLYGHGMVMNNSTSTYGFVFGGHMNHATFGTQSGTGLTFLGNSANINVGRFRLFGRRP